MTGAGTARPGARATTARDLAEHLGISVSTVGRALSDDPRISAPTRARVQALAAELGYVANRSARMMRGAPSTVVGLIVPDVRNSFFTSVAHALGHLLGTRRHQLVLCETADDRRTELQHVRDLVAAQVAGVVLVPSSAPDPETVRLLGTVPHVQLMRRVPELAPHWFGVDDHDLVRQATDHLLAAGHTRIGYVGGTAEVPTGAARRDGYRDALRDAGVAALPEHERVGPPSSTEQGGPTFGAAALRDLLSLPDRPTAVVTGSTQITRGVLAAATALRLAVPHDLSLVGFGDEPGFGWWGAGLTTVTLPVTDLATGCGAWLLGLLADPDLAADPHASVTRGALTLRGSVGRPSTVSWR
ncbi:LacI family DNA-binding transcriptional regulator [Klenkia sp. LSe6-5]|uniref:LacI family DNA-binding transcriptional regulator n=1 Tax=Klenkia sesuvii TaxID=3103137 RepID=A0ABU8DQM8_9ACTN